MTQPLNGIAATMFHGEGAIAQCGHCKRYTLDRKALSFSQPVCDCGKQSYWSGSFKPPGPDAQWFGPAPVEKAAPSALSKAAKVHAIVNTGPFPGMSEAFNAHMGAECWTDPSYAPDASTWAAAWKAALAAQQAAQPVATVKDGLTVAQPVAEVGDLIIQVRERVMARGARNRDPLYTAAPAPVGLAPLTLDQISDMEWGAACIGLGWDVRVSAVRAVERAHKIGGA